MPFFSQNTFQDFLHHQKKISEKNILDFFQQNEKRQEKFSLQQEGLLYDFSKNIIDENTLTLFKKKTEELLLKEKLADLGAGKIKNPTESRSVGHIFCRSSLQYKKEFIKLQQFVENLHQKKCFGSTAQPINTVVNIGIGGSHLGVKMAAFALDFFQQKSWLKVYFVSHYGGTELWKVLQKCKPESTLFLVCSKSFTTMETLENMQIAKGWLQQNLKENFTFHRHFLAITSQPSKAKEMGFTPEKIFCIDESIGGRFCLSSKMGLSLACLIGVKNFFAFLEGFRLVDRHLNENPTENIPLIMAWLGIWYRNFFHCSNYAVLPYAAELKYFPDYLQQLEMESNGKSVNSSNEKINYHSAPVIFGGRGSDSQHSFFQLLHQGTMQIPCDFIGFVKIPSSLPSAKIHHKKVLANYLAQQQTLAFGREKENLAPFQQLRGNQPVSSLLFDELSPKRLGQLIAIYEYKVFLQGILWDVCSFDQWGVEYGKKVAQSIYDCLENKKKNARKS